MKHVRSGKQLSPFKVLYRWINLTSRIILHLRLTSLSFKKVEWCKSSGLFTVTLQWGGGGRTHWFVLMVWNMDVFWSMHKTRWYVQFYSVVHFSAVTITDRRYTNWNVRKRRNKIVHQAEKCCNKPQHFPPYPTSIHFSLEKRKPIIT
jgi:hypothetical protein